MNLHAPALHAARDASPKVVLAVSEDRTESHGHGRPARDFDRLSELLDGVVIGNVGHSPLYPLSRRFEKATALDIGQAVHVARTFPDADAYVSFSERVGIPLALLLRHRKNRPAHIMIAHRLNSRAKRLIDGIGRWRCGVDRVITLCTAQRQYAERIVPGASVFIRQGIDERYFHPSEVEEEDYVLSVGSESRDYETLVCAILEAGLKLKILSSSPWCRKRRDMPKALPDRVELLDRMDYGALRDLYQRARVVVVPLCDVDYAAGLNGVLEGFCVNKPIIVSNSRGIADYVSHLRNACVVPVSDVDAMAAALGTVYSDALLREELKRGAKESVLEYANLDSYVGQLKLEIGIAIEAREANLRYPGRRKQKGSS